MTALIGSGFDSMGWVPEGQRSGQMSYSTASKSAAYVTIGEEDAATYEAISAGRYFEDIQARMSFRLLQKMMLKEEMAILAGNASLQLGTPATPVLSASGSGATLPAATYSVIVVGADPRRLPEFEPHRRHRHDQDRSPAPTARPSCCPAARRTQSTKRRQAVTLGPDAVCQRRRAARARSPMRGMSAPPAPRRCRRSRTINSASFSAPLAAGQQAATAITADNSANPELRL